MNIKTKSKVTKMVTMAGILKVSTPRDFEGRPLVLEGTYNLHVELPTYLVSQMEGDIEDTSPIVQFIMENIFTKVSKCHTEYLMTEIQVDNTRHRLIRGQRN